jgi:hypothetical protein
LFDRFHLQIEVQCTRKLLQHEKAYYDSLI